MVSLINDSGFGPLIADAEGKSVIDPVPVIELVDTGGQAQVEEIEQLGRVGQVYFFEFVIIADIIARSVTAGEVHVGFEQAMT